MTSGYGSYGTYRSELAVNVACLMIFRVSDDLETRILKGVSRSFYLTLRILPAPMRSAASVGYLLARTTDTIADTEGLPVKLRRELLMEYAGALTSADPLPHWPEAMLENVSMGERRLLERAGGVLEWLRKLEPQEQEMVREVVATIIGGQLMDLERFEDAAPGSPVSLPDAASLDAYTWCVAGCVGAFWTKLGYHALGARYSSADQATLLEKGIAYGKGLQLVNILRDLPEDLANGRCYLPVADPLDREALMHEFRVWHRIASEWVGEGLAYSGALGARRLRTATVLPALIAGETLEMLQGVSWESLQHRVKVPRHHVYRMLAEALFF